MAISFSNGFRLTPNGFVIPTPSVPVTVSPSITPFLTVTPSVTPSVTPTISTSTTPSVSITPSITPSVTPSISISSTPSVSVTPSISISKTPSISISSTPSVSVTPSISISKTPSVSITPTISITPSITPSSAVSGSFNYTPGSFFDVFTQQSGVTSSIGINTNNGAWQMFYANQPVTMSVGTGNIGLVPFQNGSNTWTWYVATGSVNDSTGSWSTVTAITSGTSFSYVGGQLTSSSLNTTIRIPANRYFLIANSGGPFYRTVRPLATNRVGLVSGSAFVTAVNRVALGNWPTGGTTTIPTQFGGSGTGYTEYTGSVHVMSVKFT